MRIEKDYEELLKLFNKNKVKYCIIGAYALAFYAKPRYTKDLDMVVKSDVENANKILKALNEFGFKSLKLKKEDFCKKGRVIQLGYEPIRIDILTSLEGLKFEQIWRNRVTGIYGKEKVFFIGLSNLKQNKKASKRKQDQLDFEILSSVKRRIKKK